MRTSTGTFHSIETAFPLAAPISILMFGPTIGFRNPDYLRQDYAEPSNPVGLWPNGTDHTNNKGHGIAETPRFKQI